MLIVPKEKPFIENLNSYYLDISKLLEHYQGELGSGGIHFRSSSAEGVIFFDKDEVLNGVFRGSDGEVTGREALDHLLEQVARDNFQIHVYKIDEEKVHYWANTPSAKELYRELSTEFTDLEGLIKKMGTEGFTGFINIAIGKGEEGGLLFFMNGQINGGSYSWAEGVVNGTEENNALLIRKTVETGGSFDVIEIPLSREEVGSEPKKPLPKHSSGTIRSLEVLLGLLERGIKSNKKIKAPFSKLLKKKFVEKANKYPFLDPFVAEFEYSDHKISYVGDASEKDLAKGVIESVKELAEELGILPEIMGKLKPLSEKYL